MHTKNQLSATGGVSAGADCEQPRDPENKSDRQVITRRFNGSFCVPT
jgi:hypothetical protein